MIAVKLSGACFDEGGGFKDNLMYDEGSFKNAFIDPVFENDMLKINEKRLLFCKQPFRESGLTR